jgi:hypothetical protein
MTGRSVEFSIDSSAESFSTTGATEMAAAGLVLMNAVEQYFHFRFVLSRVICGISYIELEGTIADWRTLSDRVTRFRDLDLDWWIDPLQKILQQFVCCGFW